jgi:hypothetical protein
MPQPPDPSIDELDKEDFDNLSSGNQKDIIDQVSRLSSTGFRQLGRDRKEEAIRAALGERVTLYSDKMARLPTLDGDAEIFLLNLSAHKMELAEGGEATNESGEGGNASFQTGQVEDYLTLTRFGRTAKRHIRNEESLSAVRSI